MAEEIKEIKRVLSDQVVFEGELFEIIRRTIEYINGDLTGVLEVELARRPPGIRAILRDNDHRLLLIKEYRIEHNDWDYRLAGGKVFDSLAEFRAISSDEELLAHASVALEREVLEETGWTIGDRKLLCITKAGASVLWDLYFYEAVVKAKSLSAPVVGDEIIHPEWLSVDQVLEMCINGRIKEDRTVGVLLRYIISNAANMPILRQ
jgi:8-oxo-dGTP pyrophosphatase MutT (NUDIX family)